MSFWRKIFGPKDDLVNQAAMRGDLETIWKLRDRDPNLIFARGKLGMTPLITAATYGHKHVVKYLLAEGADAEARTTNGVTPLMMASFGGRIDIIKLLLEKELTQTPKTRKARRLCILLRPTATRTWRSCYSQLLQTLTGRRTAVLRLCMRQLGRETQSW